MGLYEIQMDKVSTKSPGWRKVSVMVHSVSKSDLILSWLLIFKRSSDITQSSKFQIYPRKHKYLATLGLHSH